ncbi:MAG: hypothetical protein AAF529_08925 [Pseudomonadota bacterium]
MNVVDGIYLHPYSVRMPLMQLPVNMVQVDLAEARVLISPSLEAHSYPDAVTDIVAPNLLHHLSVPAAQQAQPQAKLWGVPGARDKLPDIHWNQELTPGNWPYNVELEPLPIAGIPNFNEDAFFHHPTGTLIVTDLCFNLTQSFGPGGWLVMQGFGTYKRFASSRFFARFVRDKAAFRTSMERIFATDFDNLIMAHGTPQMGSAKQCLRAALSERQLI